MQATDAGRRQFLQEAALIGSILPLSQPASAADANAAPVLVLGAGGGTGYECVQYLLKQGRPCIATTRTGSVPDGLSSSPLLSVAKCDVTSTESMAALISSTKLGGVIYAASASRQSDAKKTSNAKAVDQKGVVECAKLCIDNEVPRMVLVSSGGVSKPTSAVYLFLNLAANGISKFCPKPPPPPPLSVAPTQPTATTARPHTPQWTLRSVEKMNFAAFTRNQVSQRRILATRLSAQEV